MRAKPIPALTDKQPSAAFCVETVRRDFPALMVQVGKHPLVYLDNAATTHKPQCVIESLSHFYTHSNSNIHRGVHYLSEAATNAYENARRTVAEAIHAASPTEVVFVRGATEGLNLIAHTWGKTHLKAGDTILITAMEHHANIVPWQLLCEQIGCRLKVVPLLPSGEIEGEAFEQLLTHDVKLLAITHASNALGTVNPLQAMIQQAKRHGVTVVVDAAQSIAHLPLDVQALGCDFLVFSGHKVFGPTGIGIVYGKMAAWEGLPIYQGGGAIIQKVTFEKTFFKPAPECYEAGTPPIAAAIGLATALRYLKQLDLEAIAHYEQALLRYATDRLLTLPQLKIIGTASQKVPILSFTLESIHPHDVATILNAEGIAIRSGHHCTQPLMQYLGIPGTCRASFAFYNTLEEVDKLVGALHKAVRLFK